MTPSHYVAITSEVAFAARIIADGRIVAFPTSTVYGLAVDALQGNALQRLRNLKQRPAEKTFTVFMDPSLQAQFLELTDDEQRLIAGAGPHALTLLVRPKSTLTHLALDGLVGLRFIDHPLMAALAAAAHVPLTATSANIAGQPPCHNPACIQQQFPGRLDSTYDLSLGAILDGGVLPPAEPTTIAQLVDGEVKIIRQGQLTEQDIKQAIA